MSTFAPGWLTPKSVPDTLDVAGRHLTGFAKLPPEQAMRLRMQMVEAAHDCGCQWAGGAGGVVLSAYLVVSLLLPYLHHAPGTFSWWSAIAVVFVGMLLGKAFGTFRAKRSLLEAIAEFDRVLSAHKR